MSETKYDDLVTSKSTSHGPKETCPHVGKPLDGSQFLNVIEEQIYSELRPTPQEQRPIMARHCADFIKEKSDRQKHDSQCALGPAESGSH